VNAGKIVPIRCTSLMEDLKSKYAVLLIGTLSAFHALVTGNYAMPEVDSVRHSRHRCEQRRGSLLCGVYSPRDEIQ